MNVNQPLVDDSPDEPERQTSLKNALGAQHSVRYMHAVVWEVHGYCFKKCVFYKEKKVPNPLEASTEGLKSIFYAKNNF